MKLKNILFIIFLFISDLCASSPSWFFNQNLESSQSQIVGYGEGRDLKEAKAFAMDDIAQMLQVEHDSSLVIERKSSKNDYSRTTSLHITSNSKVRLNHLQLIKKERVGEKWFVALFYDTLPLVEKIIRSSLKPKKSLNRNYLHKTKLFKRLYEHFGFYPKARIYAQNGQYYLSFFSDVVSQQFLVSQEEFRLLFLNVSHRHIEILLKEQIKEGELYFVSTKFTAFGFASLFLVAQNGTLVNLFKNIELIDAKITYPDKNEYDGLQAVIEDGSRENRDVFVALLCKKKEDATLFTQISTRLEEDAFGFGELVELMDRCAFSTRVLTILK